MIAITDEKLNALELADLHVHLGATTSGATLWEIAHEQGIKLPTKDYRSFISQMGVKESIAHKKYLDKFDLTQKIQSSPYAIERSAYNAVSAAYRNGNITTLEIRFNPMLRNVKGYYDIDQIILHACIGVKKACLVYPVKAGLIVEVNRDFNAEQAEILAQKAVAFKDMGVVGFDVSGHNPDDGSFKVDTFVKAFEIAREGGLGLTFHTGEVTGADEMWQVINKINPDRIGHGVRCVDDEKLMKTLADKGTILEVCPTSNLKLGVLKNIDDLHGVIHQLKNHNVKFTINTDGPIFLDIGVVDEFIMLYQEKILNADEIEMVATKAHDYSFTKLKNL